MRAFQFWVLLICSTIVSALLIKQIFLNREIDSQQRLMVDNEEIATESAKYEEAWKELAVTVFTNSRQDPTLAAVLKDENVGISTVAPGTPPLVPSQSTGGDSSKMPAPTPVPAH